MNILYDKNDIKISLIENTKLYSFSEIVIEDKLLRYSRDLNFFEYVYNGEIKLEEVDLICKLALEDYNRVSLFFNKGIENNKLSLSLTFHKRNDISEQLRRLISKDLFSSEMLLEFCNSQHPNLTKMVKMEYFFNSQKQHNLFLGNYKEVISKDNFIGVGSSRATFKLSDEYVIKVHLNSFGTEQSYNEAMIYNHDNFIEFRDMLSKPIYVSEEYSIFEYHKPLSNTLDGCELGTIEGVKYLYAEKFDKLIDLLDSYGICGYDCLLAHNLSIDDEQIKIFDYGATYDLLDRVIESRSGCINYDSEIFDKLVDFSFNNDVSIEENMHSYRELVYKYLESYNIYLGCVR